MDAFPKRLATNNKNKCERCEWCGRMYVKTLAPGSWVFVDGFKGLKCCTDVERRRDMSLEMESKPRTQPPNISPSRNFDRRLGSVRS